MDLDLTMCDWHCFCGESCGHGSTGCSTGCAWKLTSALQACCVSWGAGW